MTLVTKNVADVFERRARLCFEGFAGDGRGWVRTSE
jgi:uncharacterized caspase-like protein